MMQEKVADLAGLLLRGRLVTSQSLRKSNKGSARNGLGSSPHRNRLERGAGADWRHVKAKASVLGLCAGAWLAWRCGGVGSTEADRFAGQSLRLYAAFVWRRFVHPSVGTAGHQV